MSVRGRNMKTETLHAEFGARISGVDLSLPLEECLPFLVNLSPTALLSEKTSDLQQRLTRFFGILLIIVYYLKDLPPLERPLTAGSIETA